MSLNSSSFFQINTKYEAQRLIQDPTRLFTLLYSKYGDIEEEYQLLHINQIMYNIPSKFNSSYKEIKYSEFIYDYLKRIYKRIESSKRIPRLSEYYKNYHLFFCRPTLRNKKLCKLMCDYQDNKAELFYKKNYQHSKDLSEKISIKEKEKQKQKNKPKNKKNSSFSISFSSLDNITNNKIIFDKDTKKMLDRAETEGNNYYNTLTLDSSRSNIITNNNCLMSKRLMDDDSFEECIYALVSYQNKRNKNKNEEIKREKKSKNKNYKKKKNIIIGDISSNLDKNFQIYKLKNIMNKSQRESNNNSNFNISPKINFIFGINKKNKNVVSKNITRVNSNFAHKNKLIYSKKKNNSLFSLSNNKYISSPTNILSTSNNNIITDKNQKKETINKNGMKKFNSKRFLNNNKSVLNFMMSNKKNKTHIVINNNLINNTMVNNNNSNIYSNYNLNISPNIDIIKNLKFDNENNYKKLSKLTEYLNQTKNKDKQDIKSNFVQKKIIHKKNSISMGGCENQNIFFNNLNNINNRVVKKKITINKNLKITISNINNIKVSNNLINSQKERHIKKNTFDFNTINQTYNFLKQNSNVTNLNIEEFNTIFNKPKKIIYKINTDYNNLKNNQILFNNEESKSKSKTKKIKKQKFSPSMKKIFNKIHYTQTASREKSIHKKNLIVNIMNPNSKIGEYEFTKESNSPNHKKNYSIIKTEDLINNNFIANFPMYKSNKRTKYYFNQSNNNINSTNIAKKNISTNISPAHNIYYSNILSSKNKNKAYQNSIEKNNIYKKTSINKNAKIINHKKVINSLINSNTNRKNKNFYSKIYLLTNINNNSNNNANNLSENKILSKKIKNVNKKSITKKDNKTRKTSYNNSKEKNAINISNSNLKNNKINNSNNITKNSIFNNLNNNISLNGYFCQNLKNNIINTNDNINISLGKNNINIKDSILHINKIYIKNNIINNINSLNHKNSRHEKNKKGKEIKSDNGRIKTVGNIIKKNKLYIKSFNSSKSRYEYSPKKINVNRNSNLTTKNNNGIKIKYKK